MHFAFLPKNLYSDIESLEHILLFFIIVYVNAAIGDSKPNPGHHSSELRGFPDCGNGEFLRHNGNVWSCVRSVNIISGDEDTMNIPSDGRNYKVIVIATYFDCIDIATSLLLDGQIIQTYSGFGGDSAGCDQNTILWEGDVAAGNHQWSINRGSQRRFLWSAYGT